jgi:hypothetical protein
MSLMFRSGKLASNSYENRVNKKAAHESGFRGIINMFLLNLPVTPRDAVVVLARSSSVLAHCPTDSFVSCYPDHYPVYRSKVNPL